MGWKPSIIKQWSCVLRNWQRCTKRDSTQRNKKVFLWANRCATSRVKNWQCRVSNYLRDKDLDFYCNTDNILCKSYIRLLECTNFENFKNEWCINVNALADGKKVRTYKLFKNEFGTEKCVELFMPKNYRSALCKFRCGVAPIRIETGRYERLNVIDRICNICDNHDNEIEDEKHVIMKCTLYDDVRETLFSDASDVCSDFLFLFGNDSMVYKFAKTCYDILARRRSFLHK
jgi:hypothetical protein